MSIASSQIVDFVATCNMRQVTRDDISVGDVHD